MAYLRSEAWQSVLAEKDIARRSLLQTALICRLTPDDLGELAGVVESGPAELREPALIYFYKLALHSDRRFNRTLRDRLLPTMIELTQRHYPGEPQGRLAFGILRHLDKNLAFGFLEAISLESVPKANLDAFLIDLSLGTASTIMRLREIQREHPEWADRIEKQLERSGQMGVRHIGTLAAEWRANRSLKTLQKLQMEYLSNAQHLPIRPILEMLGEPDSHEKNHYTYHAFTEGQRSGSLHLESDEKGRLLSQTLLRIPLD